MTIIYAFNTPAKADAGIKKRYVNYVKDMFAQGIPISNGVVLVTTLSGLTEEQISQLKICGYKNTKIQLLNGLTTNYIEVHKAYQHEDWYFLKLSGEYMTGVVDFTEMERPTDWVRPGLI